MLVYHIGNICTDKEFYAQQWHLVKEKSCSSELPKLIFYSGNTMKLTHGSLIKLGTLIGCSSLDKGLCRGFSVMLALAILANDEKSFYDRLDLIELYEQDFNELHQDIKYLRNKLKESGTYSLNEREYEVLEIPVFFEGLGIYLHPDNSKYCKRLINPIYSIKK